MGEKTLSDEELVVIVRTGDPERYRELVARYEQPLVRYASALVKDGDDAHDVVQSAFINAYGNLWRFNPQKSFSVWIYRIVRNEGLNFLRRHRRQFFGEEARLVLDQLVAKEPQPDEEVAQAELKQMVHGCLNRLPAIYREVLSLYYLEDKSYQELSDILRLPIGTISIRLRRAKAQMRRMWQEQHKDHQ